MSHVAKGSYMFLKELHLSHIRLTASGRSFSVIGSPFLNWLDVGFTCLEAAAAALTELCYGVWPALWHCGQQQLEGKCNCSFVTALLLKPAILDLLDNSLKVAAVRVLVQGDWLHMQCLQLSASCLHAEAIQYLATADWPNEQILSVAWH